MWQSSDGEMPTALPLCFMVPIWPGHNSRPPSVVFLVFVIKATARNACRLTCNNRCFAGGRMGDGWPLYRNSDSCLNVLMF